ncbi:GNAT family N-acetyltransferase [Chryseolinea sp. T2]|uniref:GNAT family N-acetyltransferase n=1 Tax=Chryseolinea sp. T2 TaxID=3129255 RepID=UPI003077262A
MKIIIDHRLPSVEEYISLRRSVEWPLFDEGAVSKALDNTLFSAVAMNEKGEAIGMGRVIGDDVVYFHIQDVIVRPEYQGQRVGNALMTALLKYVDGKSMANSNIGLMCSKGREPFYKEFGFIERPSAKFGSGMIKVVS